MDGCRDGAMVLSGRPAFKIKTVVRVTNKRRKRLTSILEVIGSVRGGSGQA